MQPNGCVKLDLLKSRQTKVRTTIVTAVGAYQRLGPDCHDKAESHGLHSSQPWSVAALNIACLAPVVFSNDSFVRASFMNHVLIHGSCADSWIVH